MDKLTREKIAKMVSLEGSVYAKQIWNAAIEEALNTLRLNTTGDWVEPLLLRIRKLKVKHSSVGISKELDAAITEEINNPPDSIMKEE